MQYMNIIMIIHLVHGLPKQMMDSYRLSCILRYIKRVKRDTHKKKEPLTPTLLYEWFDLDWTSHESNTPMRGLC